MRKRGCRSALIRSGVKDGGGMKAYGAPRGHDHLAASLLALFLCYALPTCPYSFSMDEDEDEVVMIRENMGGFDRLARIIGGVILIALSYFKLTGYALAIIWIFGLYGLVTGIIAYCPVLAVFGVNTAKRIDNSGRY